MILNEISYLRVLTRFQAAYFLDNSYSSKNVISVPNLFSVSMIAFLYVKGNHRYHPASQHGKSEHKHGYTYQSNTSVANDNHTQHSGEPHELVKLHSDHDYNPQIEITSLFYFLI